jgi:hypothetical protein
MKSWKAFAIATCAECRGAIYAGEWCVKLGGLDYHRRCREKLREVRRVAVKAAGPFAGRPLQKWGRGDAG